MKLEEAFSLKKGEVVSLVGGGGKTALLFALAEELSSRHGGIVLTTTTKIWEPAPSPSFDLFLSPELAPIKEWIGRNLQRVPYLIVAREKLENGKLQGLPPDWVRDLASLRGVSFILVEADGAAGRPVKAPRDYEPVIPKSTTLLVPVAGIDALGAPLDDLHVFRAGLAARLLDADVGSKMTAARVVRLIAMTVQRRPLGARVIPFLNKMDLPEGLEKGRRLAESLLTDSAIHTSCVVLGQAERFPRVLEVLDKSLPGVRHPPVFS